METYNFDGLKTIEECEAIEAEAQLELKEFVTQRGNINLRQDKAENTSDRNNISLSVNRAELQGLESARSTVTNQSAVKVLNNRITKVRNRVENLEVDLEGKGPSRILRLQLDINQLETLIQITNTFITGVQARKTVLAQD